MKKSKLIFPILFVFINHFSSWGQLIIPNSGFENIDYSQETKSMNWKTKGNFDLCSIDSVVVKTGNYSMHMIKKNVPGFGSFAQEIPFKSAGLRKYRIIGSIKTRNLKEGFAGVFAKVTDGNGNIICFQDMSLLKISGTQDWKTYSAEFYSDTSAVKIKMGGIIYGSGEAWFDEIRMEEIPVSPAKLSPQVKNYIAGYFKIVNENSLVKDSAYINALEQNTETLCAGNSGLDYCHSILKNYTTRKLNDGHSFFLTPQEVKDWKNGNKTIESGLANYASGKMLEGNIACINVPTFVSLDSLLIIKYVDSLQTVIAKLDGQNPKGWIIDISHNMGGNSWAMITGLGPLLGNGTCGYSVSANGNRMTRIYNEGWAGWDTTKMFQKPNPYHLRNPNLPIAIIYGNETASSGEVVAIAFRGKENTLSFGQETSGATTRIDNFQLSDGAWLNLASGVEADRKGTLFGNKIIPDRITKDNDSALAEAIKWISGGTK